MTTSLLDFGVTTHAPVGDTSSHPACRLNFPCQGVCVQNSIAVSWSSICEVEAVQLDVVLDLQRPCSIQSSVGGFHAQLFRCCVCEVDECRVWANVLVSPLEDRPSLGNLAVTQV